MLSASLAAFLAGMVLVGVGTFFAQATATGFVGRAASSDRGSASGLYLAFYFFGGLMGAAVLGQLFDRFGWEACVAGIGVSLLIAALLAVLLKTDDSGSLGRRAPRQISGKSPVAKRSAILIWRKAWAPSHP